MNYEMKLRVANDYLNSVCGLDWDDLPDINSLHDVIDKEGIISLCDDRLQESGYFDEQ